MDYIYGIISQKAKLMNYYGATTDSAVTSVNGVEISVNLTHPVPAPESTEAMVLASENKVIGWRTDAGLLIPAPKADDVGKILRVGGDGKPAWVDPNEI